MTSRADITWLELNGQRPQVADDVWLAPGARLMGRAVVEAAASVWFNAVLRADSEEIRIGPGSNVQDGAVFHVDPGYPISVGRDCTIGHGAIVHGATVEDEVLIGMGATLLNGARIGSGSIVGANALITENKVIPPNSMVLGVPGKVVRETTDAERDVIRRSAASYQRRAQTYRAAVDTSAQ